MEREPNLTEEIKLEKGPNAVVLITTKTESQKEAFLSTKEALKKKELEKFEKNIKCAIFTGLSIAGVLGGINLILKGYSDQSISTLSSGVGVVVFGVAVLNMSKGYLDESRLVGRQIKKLKQIINKDP